jgi:hypothetical protein
VVPGVFLIDMRRPQPLTGGLDHVLLVLSLLEMDQAWGL